MRVLQARPEIHSAGNAGAPRGKKSAVHRWRGVRGNENMIQKIEIASYPAASQQPNRHNFKKYFSIGYKPGRNRDRADQAMAAR